MPVVMFPDGSQHEYLGPISIMDFLNNIDPSLTNICIACSVNKKLIDVCDIINQDINLRLITKSDVDALKIIRRSCIYLLGHAIKQLWPKAKMGIGFTIDNSFCYDIDLDQSLTLKNLDELEYHMHFLVKKKYNVKKKNVSWQEAKDIFLSRDEEYKIKILNKNIEKDKIVTLYYYEEYVDICHEGPHVSNINFCQYFKLQNISGAYWLGNNKNKMLQRISGTAWSSKKDLNDYLLILEQSIKRDHRKIGKELDLYHIQEEAPGMIFWHNDGWIIFRELKSFIRNKLKEYQYQEVKTPLIIDKVLWEKTGHWENYKEHMLTTSSEKHEYCIKPMNCPGHIQIYNQSLKSYRNLPLRIAEFGSCYRNESSGSLHGLMRIKEFTQDDAHIFCTEDQILHEVKECIKMIYNVYDIFGFKKINVKLSTRPDKRIGTDKQWERAEIDLTNALSNIEFDYQLGEGAFYGPKIEFILTDSLNRKWQCGTVQLDFLLPVQLNANYINKNNQYKNPVMIHRAILGSIERFIGILIEEYGGYFPTWLAPLQIVIINVNNSHVNFVNDVYKILYNFNIRIKADLRNENIGFKIREHTIKHVPYILICGDQEVTTKKVSVRTCYGKQLGLMNIKIFAEKIIHEIKTYQLHQMEE